MTKLFVFRDDSPTTVLIESTDFDEISREVKKTGASIERWKASHDIADGASESETLSAYAREIDRLKTARGYASVDVVSLRPGNPDWPALRQKFLAEHTHDEDEVRFFVSGSGAFYLHVDAYLYQIVCEQGDLLSVPAGTRHWFDGGPDANFTCIRLFTRQEGWIAHLTGSPISEAFPKHAEV